MKAAPLLSSLALGAALGCGPLQLGSSHVEPDPEPLPTPVPAPPPGPPIVPSEEGRIAGGVKHWAENVPIADAVVVLQCSCLPAQQERLTDQWGTYSFDGLPEGNYTIQVLKGQANTSKVTYLPEGAKYRANFTINPDARRPVTIVIEGPGLPSDGRTLPPPPDCFVERRSPIYFRTTVGNSLRDAVEASTYGSSW